VRDCHARREQVAFVSARESPLSAPEMCFPTIFYTEVRTEIPPQSRDCSGSPLAIVWLCFTDA
jgi:hypothetical protein